MYFVDREQIDQRLTYIDTLLQASAQKLEAEKEMLDPLIRRLAWERVLHMAIESVTDIGSMMIDGFIMRDASSYEDIIEILRDEKVFDEPTGQALVELVKLRRPLVQQYFELDEQQLVDWVPQISQLLRDFSDSVNQYLDRELVV